MSINSKSKSNLNLRSNKLISFLGKSWSVIFLLILVLIFALRGVNIFRIDILQNVLLAATLIMLIGIGETFVIISGGIDISPMYVVGLTGAIGGIIMRDLYAANYSQAFVIPIGVAAILFFSLIPGLMNGLLITRLKVPPFIVTIGTMSIAMGSVFLLNKGMPVIGQPPLVGRIGNSFLFYYIRGEGITFIRPEGLPRDQVINILPVPVLLLAIVALIAAFILSKTIFGQHVYAIGGNISAAELSGIPINIDLIKVYVLASLTYGLAGMVYLFRFSSITPSAGEPLLISAIAGVFIGGASMSGGYGSINGTVIGALIIGMLQVGLVMSGVSSFWQYIAVGFVIILAVLFDSYKSRFLES